MKTKQAVALAIFIGSLFFSATLQAQTLMDDLLNVKFVYGEAVLNNDDTIRGAFEFNDGPDNYKNLVYRSTESSAKQLFVPDDVRVFYMNNNWYFPKEYDGTKYFMLLCYNDSMSVYQHRHYFTTAVSNTYNNYYLLEKPTGERLMIKTGPEFNFKSKVGTFFSDCAELEQKIKKGKYGKDNLMDIAREYNDMLRRKK